MMETRRNPIRLIIALVNSAIMLAHLPAAEIKHLAPKDKSLSCVVASACDLLHTTQIDSVNSSGLESQTEGIIASLRSLLTQRGSSWDNIVKLNVYATNDADAETVTTILKSRFPENRTPAIAGVATALTNPMAKVAIDAVAAVERPVDPLSDHTAALLKSGPRVYVSGQAEKGDGTVADATKKTMASLGRTLDFIGLNTRDVVQVKCFINPIIGVPDAAKEIDAWFRSHGAPSTPPPSDVPHSAPVIFVEWQSTLPIEIEMIASGHRITAGPSLEVRTPPGMTTPAVYSRLSIVRHLDTIYISGMCPTNPSATSTLQLRSLFSQLKQCLDVTGSDWMHLVKATYYVSDEALSKEHNVVRPDYFSPRRPPAASKATVRGVGKAGHGISMDFIAIPGEP